MKHSTKLVLNTIATYGRIIVNTIVTLLATRIALKCLGAEEYGLYNLIAGIIVLLSFVNGALMISSQRYFSIAIGEKNFNKLDSYFNASLGIHILLGLFLLLILWSIKGFLFDNVLNINPSKVELGKQVYDLMNISAFVTVSTIPFSAIINAKEDMVYLAFCNICACIIKLIAAVTLLFINNHLLLVYTILMLASLFVKFFMELIWDKTKYKEIRIKISQLYNKALYVEMLSFIGWNTLGSFAVVIRNQGVAVILNMFFGTIINAAYGIANQVNALILSFATALTTVFTPMIIQAKGEGNEKKMLTTAIFSSKISFYLSSIMALTILTFLDEILNMWLGEYPVETNLFCFYIILSFLVLQIYPGLNRAIYAVGKIKGYQISISVILVAVLPLGYSLFKMGFPPYSILVAMFVLQFFTLISTVYFAQKYCNLDTLYYSINSIVIPIILFCIFLYLGKKCIILINVSDIFSVIIYAMIICILYSIVYFYLIFNSSEKKMLIGLTNKR